MKKIHKIYYKREHVLPNLTTDAQLNSFLTESLKKKSTDDQTEMI